MNELDKIVFDLAALAPGTARHALAQSTKDIIGDADLEGGYNLEELKALRAGLPVVDEKRTKDILKSWGYEAVISECVKLFQCMLKQLRAAKKLNQTDLAKMIGRSGPTICGLEKECLGDKNFKASTRVELATAIAEALKLGNDATRHFVWLAAAGANNLPDIPPPEIVFEAEDLSPAEIVQKISSEPVLTVSAEPDAHRTITTNGKTQRYGKAIADVLGELGVKLKTFDKNAGLPPGYLDDLASGMEPSFPAEIVREKIYNGLYAIGASIIQVVKVQKACEDLNTKGSAESVGPVPISDLSSKKIREFDLPGIREKIESNERTGQLCPEEVDVILERQADPSPERAAEIALGYFFLSEREKQGKDIDDLASISGCSLEDVSSLEEGRLPSFRSIVSIAQALKFDDYKIRTLVHLIILTGLDAISITIPGSDFDGIYNLALIVLSSNNKNEVV
jgi:transcriptional regulator with XRE-family HTH domain